MYTIKTLNAISPVGLAKLNNKQFDVAVDTDAPDGILVRSADMLNTAFNDNLLAIARAGAGVNNIPLDRCSEQIPMPSTFFSTRMASRRPEGLPSGRSICVTSPVMTILVVSCQCSSLWLL